MGLSGVAAVTATAAAAMVAAESAGAAFWVSGFVPRPLALVRPRNPRGLLLLFDPTRFGKAAMRAAHECGTVGQRTP